MNALRYARSDHVGMAGGGGRRDVRGELVMELVGLDVEVGAGGAIRQRVRNRMEGVGEDAARELAG
jgi:hypothetical protein